MKNIIAFSLLALASASLAQTAPSTNPWSTTEFLTRNDSAMVELYNLKSFTPFKSVPNFTLDFDTFGGYSTTTNSPVTGIAGLGNYYLNNNLSLILGIGDELSLNNQFTLSEITTKGLGLVLGVSYKF